MGWSGPESIQQAHRNTDLRSGPPAVDARLASLIGIPSSRRGLPEGTGPGVPDLPDAPRSFWATTLAPGIWREPGRLAVEYDLHVCDTSGTGTHGPAARPPPSSTAGRSATSRPATRPRLSDGRPGPMLVRTRGRMMRPCPTTHGTDSQGGPCQVESRRRA